VTVQVKEKKKDISIRKHPTPIGLIRERGRESQRGGTDHAIGPTLMIALERIQV